MASQRQEQTVATTRDSARQIDDGFEGIESAQERYDVLNSETPNFADGYFATPQEIAADALLGVFNAHTALRNAAPNEYAAMRAAMKRVR